jgi:hypothetical protein
MPGIVPHCVPVETKQNQHGERASTIVVGTERVLTRGKWRTVEVLACPVTWRPYPEQIASARRGYDDWWQALDWVRDGLVVSGMLREVEVTAAMPKVRPWRWYLRLFNWRRYTLGDDFLLWWEQDTYALGHSSHVCYSPSSANRLKEGGQRPSRA